MPNFIYKDNIPFPTNNPSTDQPDMLTNTNSIDSIIGIDHFSFNNTNGGTHQQVQLFNSPGINGAIPPGLQGNGWETIYASATAGNGELWFTRGSTPTGIQLTGPGVPSALQNGSTFLPGGLIFQWGRSPGGSLPSSGTITFPTPFINNFFVVNITLIANSSGTGTSNTISYLTGSGTLLSFKWNYTGTTSYVGFYWMAIGN
jgi:hypothetical protein